MRPPLTTVNQHDHAAAAAYLMKHAKDANDVRVDAVMNTRPAVTTTTSIGDKEHDRKQAT
ncbi:MAG TPA: hypothetical protein VFO01_14005 [Trebonia sp.]|nr:hypothetical protein [Trebonia sp.]